MAHRVRGFGLAGLVIATFVLFVACSTEGDGQPGDAAPDVDAAGGGAGEKDAEPPDAARPDAAVLPTTAAEICDDLCFVSDGCPGGEDPDCNAWCVEDLKGAHRPGRLCAVV